MDEAKQAITDVVMAVLPRAFPDLQARASGRDTVLSGVFTDQAALYGVLAQLEALGLEYRFIGRWLRGEYASEAEMVQRPKYAIHDFTRRQLSWFRRDSRIIWIDGGEGMAEQAEQIVDAFLVAK